LLERDDDLAALAGHLGRARDGQGGMAVVTGESGAGKSTLLQAFTELGVDDVPILWGACDPLTTPRPLGPFHDLAAQLGGDVSDALRDAAQPHEIFMAVFEHLRLHPSVLVVDDLHWADQGTIDLLRFLLRRIRVTRSLVVGAMRDDEIGTAHPLRALLGDIARSPDAEALTLRPLSVDAIGALIEDRAVDPAWLHGLTGGNPFYVVEMLANGGGEIPRTVRDAILARTHGLTPEAWDLLHLLASAPEAIPDHLLADLGIGLPPLRELDQAGLIRRGPRGVGFRHDLCRIAISDTVPPGGAVSFHRRMLHALDAAPNADPAVLVHHSVGAGDAVRTLRHATDAGRAAARSGAHTQAAAFFASALEQHVPLSSADEAALLELLAGEYYLIDRLDDAIVASERAMALRERSHDAAGVSINHHALSTYQWYNANRDVADRHAAAAEDVLEHDPALQSEVDLGHLGHAFAMQAYLAVQSNDIERARTLLARARDLSSRVDDQPLAVRVRLISGICDVLEGDRGGRDATLTILEGSHEQFDEIYSSGYSNLTYLDVEQRRLRHASELLGFTLPLTIERDLPICRVWQLGSRGRMKLIRGDWADALADADLVLGGPCAPLARTWPYLVRGLVSLRRGLEADADLEEAWLLACRFGEPIRLLPAAAALVERSWLRGIDDSRIDECRSLLATASGAGLEWARGELATWLHRLDTERGRVPPDDLVLQRVAEPYRLQLDGRADAAATSWAQLSAPYDSALALIDSGDAESVRAGLDLLDRLGADAVAAKVRQDLRRGGATTIPSRRREATLTNPAGLTNRQVEILSLLADGSTNVEIAQRLFISTKTVDHHVSAVLSKLQVASRRDAVRRGGELGLLD
jgi:DNA-binding CsgD family transcriptional regulator/energy-coupling factor transporter ATP-binding protein EcfA2